VCFAKNTILHHQQGGLYEPDRIDCTKDVKHFNTTTEISRHVTLHDPARAWQDDVLEHPATPDVAALVNIEHYRSFLMR
jgi:hypothetical protein